MYKKYYIRAQEHNIIAALAPDGNLHIAGRQVAEQKDLQHWGSPSASDE
ncbi:hypothetical protein [Streptomyces sp. NPDC003863]